MFYLDTDEQLTFDGIQNVILKFKSQYLPRLTKLNNYYCNKNGINKRAFEDASKPNNKISHSFGHYITETNTTMFLGKEISYTGTGDLEDYNNVLVEANEQDINLQLATAASKYGYAIQLIYLDEEAQLKFSVLNNLHTILIFDNSIQKRLKYTIRFWEVQNIYNELNKYIEVYSDEGIKLYKNSTLIKEQGNLFSSIPIVIYKNNDNEIGDFENVISLIDAYDALESDSINEADYFNNAYLYLNTDTIEADTVADMKNNRIIYGENLNPQFILKNANNADGDIEKKRIVEDIFRLSFTPNLSDENFANNVSGVAMRYKLLGILNNIANKQRKFTTAIRMRDKIVFEYLYMKSMVIPEYVEIIFTVNLPMNDLETAQTINQLRGLVSDETLISQLSFVNDAEYEKQKIDKENELDIYEQ